MSFNLHLSHIAIVTGLAIALSSACTKVEQTEAPDKSTTELQSLCDYFSKYNAPNGYSLDETIDAGQIILTKSTVTTRSTSEEEKAQLLERLSYLKRLYAEDPEAFNQLVRERSTIFFYTYYEAI